MAVPTPIPLEIQISEKLEHTITSELSVIKSSITPEGLILDTKSEDRREKDKNPGYTSELLGYGMRVAVETGDPDLFEQLYNGYKLLQAKGVYGLPIAEVDSGYKKTNPGGSESWADADQDIALSLIDAGKKWEGTYTQAGIALAKNFINSPHVRKVGPTTIIQNSTTNHQSSKLGPNIAFVDPSLWNFRLISEMKGLSPEEAKWQELYESGVKILRQSLDLFKLPTNRIPLINGEAVTFEDLTENLQVDADLINTIPLDRSIIPALVEKVKELATNYCQFGWDAVRIPFRLADVEDPELQRFAIEIYQRLSDLGGVGVGYDSLTGFTRKYETLTASVAPLLATQIGVEGINSDVIRSFLSNIEEEETKMGTVPNYHRLWRVLGMLQLERVL